MISTRKIFLLLFVFVAANVSAFAYPNFLEDYKADRFSKMKDAVCDFCHMSPTGGDERNPFGKVFEAGGEKFTPMLRAQFPERFSYPMVKVNDTFIVHFSDPDNKIVVVESGGTRVAVDIEKHTVDGKPAGAGIASAQPVPAGTRMAVQSTRERKSEIPTDPYAREGAFFGQNVVDLPNGKAEKKGGVDFWIGHRFPEKTFQRASPARLFGFDSSATVAFGVRVGLTDRLSIAATRTNYFRTVELSSAFQVSRQDDGMPVTLQVRGSVEGRNNFVRYKDTLPWIGYAPAIQVVAVRTFADRLSLEAVPTFAFNTRNENSFFPQIEPDHDNTINMGIGVGLRVLSSTSLVGEWVPRLWGYRGERVDRPEIAFGIQQGTYRHAFSLVFSTMQPMTVARYAQGAGGGATGADTFGIGFNIYRRLR